MACRKSGLSIRECVVSGFASFLSVEEHPLQQTMNGTQNSLTGRVLFMASHCIVASRPFG